MYGNHYGGHGMKLRKGCRTSKFEKKCMYYDYSLSRCTLGKVKYTCELIKQPKEGTKAFKEAESCRAFYGVPKEEIERKQTLMGGI